jgi:hypothetical protein
VAKLVNKIPFKLKFMSVARDTYAQLRALRLRRAAMLSGDNKAPEMTPDTLRQACIEEEGAYETPELNDVLHLSYHGFREIKNLGALSYCMFRLEFWLLVCVDSRYIRKLVGLSAGVVTVVVSQNRT